MNNVLDDGSILKYISPSFNVFFTISAVCDKRKGNMRSTEFPGDRRQAMSTITVIFKRNQRIKNYIHEGYIGHPKNTTCNREWQFSIKQNKVFNICVALDWTVEPGLLNPEKPKNPELSPFSKQHSHSPIQKVLRLVLIVLLLYF